MSPMAPYWAITIKVLDWMVAVLALALVSLIAGGVFAARKWLSRVKKLSGDIEAMRVELAQCTAREKELQAQLSQNAEHDTKWISARDAYLQFIYNISHEVSKPLQGILTTLDNMARDGPEQGGRWRQRFGIIRAEVRRLRKLTEDLLLLSRLQTPRAHLVRESVNIREVIQSVIATLGDEAEKRAVHLRMSDVPERPARVFGNRDYLHQALRNLVDNAIKYSKEGGGDVIIGVQEEEDRLCVRVSDEGIGIPEGDLPHIFDTAYRALDARSLQRGGTGLGLAVAKRVVELHGGEIGVESKSGEGTTFSFYLPLYIAQ